MVLRRQFRLISALGAGCCVLSPNYAAAQSTTDTDRASKPGELEQIIVTARRREEELQHAPVSVISLSANNLESRSVTNLRDLQNFVPNLTLAPSQNVGDAAGNIFIRGIGQEDFVAGAEAGVGLYLDGIYVSRTMGNLLDLIDIERIEVLRGPQGTLYGKNTIGGAINIISAAPRADAEGYVDLIVGKQGRVELRGMANAPLSARLFARLSGGRLSRGGYLKRLRPTFAPTLFTETDHRSEGRNDSAAGRLQLRWLASPSLTIDLSADASRRRGTQAATHVDAVDPRFGILPAVNGLIGQGRLPGPAITNALVTGDRLISFAGGSNAIAQDLSGLAGTVTKDVGAQSIKLTTAYRGLHSHVATDLDGTWFAILGSDFRERHRQFSAELQASGTLGRVDYTAGLFALAERMRTSSGRGVSRADVLYLCGCFYAPEHRPVLSFTKRRQSGDSYAAYAQASFHLNRRLSATLGGRFSHERKRTAVELVQLEPDTLQPTNLVLRTGMNRGRWNSLTWRAGLELQATRDLMLFASAAKGYKSGGFNTRPVVNVPNLGINQFAPEAAVTYEAGLRSEWFGRRLRLNATLFHTDYRGIQLRRQTFFDGILTTLVENAAHARIRGAEIEATATLNGRLTASLAYGYLAPRYLDVGRVPGLTLDSDFQRTPRHSVTSSFDYSVPAGEGSLTLHGDYSYRSREQFQLVASPFDQPGYGLLGVRLTFRDTAKGWSVALFGTNLTDERYRGAGRDALNDVGFANSLTGMPRQIGVELRAGF